jgi:hypothetical protein
MLPRNEDDLRLSGIGVGSGQLWQLDTGGIMTNVGKQLIAAVQVLTLLGLNFTGVFLR